MKLKKQRCCRPPNILQSIRSLLNPFWISCLTRSHRVDECTRALWVFTKWSVMTWWLQPKSLRQWSIFRPHLLMCTHQLTRSPNATKPWHQSLLEFLRESICWKKHIQNHLRQTRRLHTCRICATMWMKSQTSWKVYKHFEHRKWTGRRLWTSVSVLSRPTWMLHQSNQAVARLDPVKQFWLMQRRTFQLSLRWFAGSSWRHLSKIGQMHGWKSMRYPRQHL